MSMPLPNDKKNGSATKAPAKSKAMLRHAATGNVPVSVFLIERTSTNPGVVLGLNASAMENPVVAEKLL